MRQASIDVPYGELCPQCGGKVISRCRCISDHPGHGMTCAAGHNWKPGTGRKVTQVLEAKET